MRNSASPHLTDTELLRHLDGEQALKSASAAHLDACWSCRARCDELESVMHAFVRLRQEVLTAVPDPPAVWPGLESGMDRVDADASLHGGWTSRLRRQRSVRWWSTAAAVAGFAVALSLAGVSLDAAEVIRSAIRAIRTLTFGPATPVQSVIPSRVLSPTLGPVRPAVNPDSVSAVVAPEARPVVNLVDTEIDALRRLHQIDALTSEEIEIVRGPSRLSIRARIATAQRKAQMIAALAPIAATGAEVRVETYDELAAKSVRRQTATNVAFHEVDIITNRFVASQLVTDHFTKLFGPDAPSRVADAVQQYASESLEGARRATLSAFALRRLSERFSATTLSAAHPQARETFASLVREYAGSVETQAARLASHFDDLFHASAIQPEPVEGSTAATVATRAEALEDEVRALFAVQATTAEARAIDGGRLLELARALQHTAAYVRERTLR